MGEPARLRRLPRADQAFYDAFRRLQAAAGVHGRRASFGCCTRCADLGAALVGVVAAGKRRKATLGHRSIQTTLEH